MNKIVLSVLIFLFAMNGFAQEGVKFMEGSFQEALNVAKQQKKMVYFSGPKFSSRFLFRHSLKENGFRGCLYVVVRTVSLDERGGIADAGGCQVFR